MNFCIKQLRPFAVVVFVIYHTLHRGLDHYLMAHLSSVLPCASDAHLRLSVCHCSLLSSLKPISRVTIHQCDVNCFFPQRSYLRTS